MNTPWMTSMSNDTSIFNPFCLSTRNALMNVEQKDANCYLEQNLKSKYAYSFQGFNDPNKNLTDFNTSCNSIFINDSFEQSNPIPSVVKNVMDTSKEDLFTLANYTDRLKYGASRWEIDSNSKSIDNQSRNNDTLSHISDKIEHYRRKSRKPYSRQQLMVLEKEYSLMPYVTRQRRWEISNKLQLTERQVRLKVKVWFQNRRMKTKKLKTRSYPSNCIVQHNVNKTTLNAEQYSALSDKQKFLQLTNHWNQNISSNSVISSILNYNIHDDAKNHS
ncbi:unnamed protein product [Trichobilharzia szidati]|nr:unnamed protein product [Trichobilharzia szidati]CAH8849470.1 unnamed protein product [Trichobilharzia szidati]